MRRIDKPFARMVLTVSDSTELFKMSKFGSTRGIPAQTLSARSHALASHTICSPMPQSSVYMVMVTSELTKVQIKNRKIWVGDKSTPAGVQLANVPAIVPHRRQLLQPFCLHRCSQLPAAFVLGLIRYFTILEFQSVGVIQVIRGVEWQVVEQNPTHCLQVGIIQQPFFFKCLGWKTCRVMHGRTEKEGDLRFLPVTRSLWPRRNDATKQHVAQDKMSTGCPTSMQHIIS